VELPPPTDISNQLEFNAKADSLEIERDVRKRIDEFVKKKTLQPKFDASGP
jgi:hypothetical protein